jgi:2-dehydropantoate 2-reductase
VTLVVRPRMLDELREGLTVSDLDGASVRATPRVATALGDDAEIILVTVKSGGTAEAARALAGTKATVISLQNGVRNVPVLRETVPAVLAGMVPFNVIRREAGHYHRASAGTIMVEAGAGGEAFARACAAAKLPLERPADMLAVQWSKLVLNLNNAINALSGLPLATELADRDFRRCLAAAQREALAILQAAGQPLARLTLLPPSWIPKLLPVPDGLFKRLAKRIVAIDPAARSSMWDDLEARRATEIDYLQGEVIALAEKLGRKAPVNQALRSLVKAAETGGKRDWTGAALLSELRLPRA